VQALGIEVLFGIAGLRGNLHGHACMAPHKDELVTTGGLAAVVQGMQVVCAGSGDADAKANLFGHLGCWEYSQQLLTFIAEGSDERRDAAHQAVLGNVDGGLEECTICKDEFFVGCGSKGRALRLPCTHL
jgi:hypothetical protein